MIKRPKPVALLPETVDVVHISRLWGGNLLVYLSHIRRAKETQRKKGRVRENKRVAVNEHSSGDGCWGEIKEKQLVVA